jgi:hypothetical protein
MVRNIGVNFNGRHVVHPGAHARVNADGLSALGTSGARKIAFIGSSTGGEPNVVHTFDNPSDAKEVLRGGDLMKAGELAWAPSGDGSGAGTVSFIRVESAEKASLVKGDVTFKALDWGKHTNDIQVSLEDGTLSGSKKLTYYYWPEDLKEVYDNIGPIFKVSYSGAGAATLNITEVQTGVKALTIAVDTTDVMSYTLGNGEFADINKIVHDINEHVDFNASMVTSGNKNLNSGELDEVAGVDLSTEQVIQAVKGDLLYQTRYSELAEIEFAGTETIPENFTYEYMTNGADGEVPASWTDLLNKLYGEGVYIVVPLTGDEAVHNEVARFVQAQSTLERNHMLGIYGGRTGDSVDDAIGRALTFNSSRAIVAYPGITRAVGQEESETLPSYFTAAMIAGRLAGKETGDPITLDYLSLVGLEKVLTVSEIDRLITSGVTAVEFVRQSNRKGYRIAQGVTTYQKDSNPNYREISMRTVSDELSSGLVEHLEDKFAGGKGTFSSVALIKNEAQSFLDRKKREEVIVDYDPESVEVRLEGDRVYVDYAAIPVGAINYILITAKYYQQQILA